MSDMNEYPNYQQPGYQQQYYAQSGYQQQPYQPNYAWGTPAPTIPVSKAKFPVAAMILIGIAAMAEMFFFIQNIVEGYSMYLFYLLLFAAYALFIVDMARFRADKHIFAGIALMLFASITLYNIFANDCFESIGYDLEYEEFLYALRLNVRLIVLFSEPVFYILGGLYFLLSKKGFWALKLVLGILVMINSTLSLVIYFESINTNILLNFIWGTCLGLGFILYSPVKDRM